MSGIALARPRSPLAGIVVLSLVQLVLVFDIVGVNMDLPRIQRDFAVGTGALTWLLTAYALCYGALPFFAGRLGEAVGRRRALVGGLVLFGCSAVLAATANSWSTILIARAGQGVGAGLAAGAALTLLEANYPEGRIRSWALTSFFVCGGIAVPVSPLLAAYVVEYLGDWQSLFWADAVVGLLGAVLVLVSLGETAPGSRAGLLRAAGIGVLLVVLSRASTLLSGVHGPAALVIGAMVALAVAPTVLTWVGPREADGTRNVFAWLRRNRAAVGGYSVVALVAVCLFGTLSVLDLVLQDASGLSPVDAFGQIAVAGPALVLGCAVMSPLAKRIGLRPVLAGAALVAAAGLALLGHWFAAGADGWVNAGANAGSGGGPGLGAAAGAFAPSGTVLPLVLIGLGAGVVAVPTAFARGGAGMAGLNSARQLGVSLGSRIAFGLLTVATARAAAAAEPPQGAATVATMQAVQRSGIAHGGLLFAQSGVALCLAAALIAVVTQRPARDLAVRAEPAMDVVG